MTTKERTDVGTIAFSVTSEEEGNLVLIVNAAGKEEIALALDDSAAMQLSATVADFLMVKYGVEAEEQVGDFVKKLMPDEQQENGGDNPHTIPHWFLFA